MTPSLKPFPLRACLFLENALTALWTLAIIGLLGALIAFLGVDWLYERFIFLTQKKTGQYLFENAQQMAGLAFLYLLAFGGALAAARMEHLRVDLLENVLSPKIHLWQTRIFLLIAAVCAAWLAKIGWEHYLSVAADVAQTVKDLGDIGMEPMPEDLAPLQEAPVFALAMGLAALQFFLKIFTYAPTDAEEPKSESAGATAPDGGLA